MPAYPAAADRDDVSASPSHLGLLAEQHRSHEQRLDRASAVRRKRVAFGTPRPFPRAEARRLVERCHGVMVAPDEQPDVLVLTTAAGARCAPIGDDSSLVVDADEFVRMVSAYADTHRSPRLAAAVAAARSDLRTGTSHVKATTEALAAVTRGQRGTGGLRVSDGRRSG
jgi:hypothetical protein